MTVQLRATAEFPTEAATVARGVYSGRVPADGMPVDLSFLERSDFSGDLGESVVVLGPDGGTEILVGLGDPERLSREALRRVGAAISRAARKFGTIHIDLSVIDRGDHPTELVAEAIGEGALLAAYRFDSFKSAPKADEATTLIFVGPSIEETERAIGRAEAVAGAVNDARDLVNTPAGDLSPRRLAERAVELGAERGFDAEVLDEAEIAALRLGGLLGVAAGSTEPPRFVRLRYVPDGGATTAVALVGKGITFDSGGLSLKPAASMMSMKTDMGGAAAVLGAFCAMRALGVGVEVRGYLAITENMPSGSATRPGDVLRTRSGKTIEVLNTDAEGRLVLSDALTLAREDGADAIVDLATLTGACVVALGNKIAGVLGNDDRLISAVRQAADRAGEAVWPLPLPLGYHSHIESEIADMKNIGATGQAGALSAALLLQEFVGDVPWVHLDIAGPVRSEEDRGYLRKGATGFGVRTILELLTEYQPFGGVVEGEAEGIGVLR